MTAVKLRIQNLIEGRFDGRTVHTVFGEISEARILGTLIDVFVTDDESYMSLTVDDGTETIRTKAWRQDVKKLKKFARGDLIDVVGKVREYNGEIYLIPEVVLKVPPNKWILRELELMKSFLEAGGPVLKQSAPVREIEEVVKEETEREIAEPKRLTEEKIGEIETEKEKRMEKTERGETQTEPEKKEEISFEEVGEFEIFGEDEVVETVLDFLREGMTREVLIEKSGLDEIDVELALRELLDEKKIVKEGNLYRRI